MNKTPIISWGEHMATITASKTVYVLPDCRKSCSWNGKTKEYPLLLIPNNFLWVQGTEQTHWQQHVSTVIMHKNPTAGLFTSTLIFLLKTQTQTTAAPALETLIQITCWLLYLCLYRSISLFRAESTVLEMLEAFFSRAVSVASADIVECGDMTVVHF